MKLFRSIMLLSCAAFLLTSCGNNDSGNQTKTDTTKMDNSSSTQPAPVEKNTIVTSPQTMVSVTHKVSDYQKWQASYDGHDSARVAYGLHNYVIARGFNDPNMVMVVLKTDDVEKAKAFTKDPSLKKAMQKGGVSGVPTIDYMTAVWQDTGMLAPNTLRSRTTFAVKDWDAWLKTFQDGKQERMDNGIVDRVIGHSVDDNKKVMLVTAVMDSTKAFAYYKSDALKKRREAGGVIGTPQRFLFQIAKRY